MNEKLLILDPVEHDKAMIQGDDTVVIEWISPLFIKIKIDTRFFMYI